MMKNLFFAALVPPKDLSEQIREFSRDFAERFSSFRSFRHFPHITVLKPFGVHERQIAAMLEIFSRIKLDTETFNVELGDFGAFEKAKNPVIFLKIKNKGDVAALQEELLQKIGFPYEPYSPHLTVAYRDLSPENFHKAWPEYQNKRFSANFNADRVNLYQHDGKKWHQISETLLAPPETTLF